MNKRFYDLMKVIIAYFQVIIFNEYSLFQAGKGLMWNPFVEVDISKIAIFISEQRQLS